jgi:predicted DCC family thiol-disulfide oxidoreductase YuxK
MTTPASLVVFYDADCGFCTRSALILRRLDWLHHLEIVPLGQAHDVVPDAPPEAELLERMHARDADGEWFIGGQAWLRITDELPLLRPLGLVARLPLIRDLVEPVYAVIAGNRHRISLLLGDAACRVRPARR